MQEDSQREMKSVNSICSGIVTYNPEIDRLKKVISSIVDQVEELVICDNGSVNASDIKETIELYSNVTALFSDKNEGIARALNNICEYAKVNHYEWVLTLDQDTICPDNIIQELSRALFIEKVGIICPVVMYEGLNLTTGNKNQDIEGDNACMTSASLTNIQAWERVGGFRDDYFIDFVDNEFCMKLQIYGYKILRVNTCRISHQLGDSKQKRFLWKIMIGTSHKPWRIYYMMRNNIWFINEYGAFLNVTKEYFKVLYIFINELFFSDTKVLTLKNGLKGIYEGMKYNRKCSM